MYIRAKRGLSLTMALLMLLSVLLLAVSCAENVENPVESGSLSQSVAETEEELAYNTVEKEKFNREFSILTREEMINQFKIEEYTGDLLNDLIYERNVTVS